MNNRIYRVTIDIINLILGFLTIYAMMFTILLITKSNAAPFLLFLFSLSGALLSYYIKRYAKHIWAFLLFHFLLILILIFLVPSTIGKLLCAFFMLAVTIYSLVKRLREEEMARKNVTPSLLLVFALLYVINYQLRFPELTHLLFGLTVTFILLFFINSYLINFEHYFSLQQETSNVPLKQIKTVNHTIIIFFLGLSFANMFFFTKLPLKELLLSIQKGLLKLIRMVLSLLPEASSKIEETQENAPKKVPIPKHIKVPENTPSPLWEFIQNLITTLLIAAVIIGTIALISYAIYKLYQAFYKEKRSLFKDNTEFISPFDRREKAIKNKSIVNKNSFFRFWNQTNSDKIRRAFYKAVLSKKGKPPKVSATPWELSRYILSDNSSADIEADKKTEALAYYYEKARYNKADCTKEDIENFKKLLY
ncbi:hypothetical protein [Anaerocolumna xylanovorans]|uniref:DUF4129 domain-containing protein n=1 Tax=Anaerocolumna xylanovorans DSM 12503 TaxID=1121345 RepID=A0A1M7Y5P5_9FIRM|nr:hypothetical protein [Anaerocolumna xylanovorans]SHO47843.1 hypothetical protein SAMN02745217_01675 [Anaerocolumna xylanovorans DSM 12503]